MTTSTRFETEHEQLAGRVLAVVAVVVAIGVWSCAAFAQTALVGGTVRTGNGEVIEDGTVVFQDGGAISSVGADVDVPDDATTVDVSGHVVTPGLIDVETHLGLAEVWSVGSSRDLRSDEKDPIHAAFRSADALHDSSPAIPIQRTGGVTSVLTTPVGGLVSGQSAWLELAGGGFRTGEVFRETVGMHVQMGSRRDGSRGRRFEQLRQLYDDVQAYETNERAYDSRNLRELTASRLDLEAMGKTLNESMPVVFEVQRASEIVRTVEFCNEYNLDPILVGATEAWEVREMLAEQDVPVVVDPMVNLPWDFDRLAARSDNAALLAEAGVPVILSTFSTHNVRRLPQKVGNAIRAGLDRREALRAVTSRPAEVFGLTGYGELSSGARANVVVWSGDPFELSTDVEKMYVGGREVSLDHRQKELYERYKTLERRGEPAPKTPESDDEQTDQETQEMQEGDESQ
jgi:imidazolonepropionase-like amidohydrolase